MTDQRRHAGNLGDVVKHAVLVDVAKAWVRALGSGLWVETHAGFHDYEASVLGGRGWDARRQPTLGALAAACAEGVDLGDYGAVIAPWLAAGSYPGSLAAVADAAPELRLRGHDLGAAQVASFASDPRIEVRAADGFAGVADADVVVCDPFWDDPATFEQVATLVAQKPSILVWYPQRDELSPARWQQLGLNGVHVAWRGAAHGLAGTGMAWRLPPPIDAAATRSLERVAGLLDLSVRRWRAAVVRGA